MTPLAKREAQRIVAQAVARQLEGLGFREVILNYELELTVEEDMLLRAAFKELVDELHTRGGGES